MAYAVLVKPPTSTQGMQTAVNSSSTEAECGKRFYAVVCDTDKTMSDKNDAAFILSSRWSFCGQVSLGERNAMDKLS